MLATVLIIEAIRIAIVVLLYAAAFAIWLGRWAWFGTQMFIEKRRAKRERDEVPEHAPL